MQFLVNSVKNMSIFSFVFILKNKKQKNKKENTGWVCSKNTRGNEVGVGRCEGELVGPATLLVPSSEQREGMSGKQMPWFSPFIMLGPA